MDAAAASWRAGAELLVVGSALLNHPSGKQAATKSSAEFLAHGVPDMAVAKEASGKRTPARRE